MLKQMTIRREIKIDSKINYQQNGYAATKQFQYQPRHRPLNHHGRRFGTLLRTFPKTIYFSQSAYWQLCSFPFLVIVHKGIVAMGLLHTVCYLVSTLLFRRELTSLSINAMPPSWMFSRHRYCQKYMTTFCGLQFLLFCKQRIKKVAIYEKKRHEFMNSWILNASQRLDTVLVTWLRFRIYKNSLNQNQLMIIFSKVSQNWFLLTLALTYSYCRKRVVSHTFPWSQIRSMV